MTPFDHHKSFMPFDYLFMTKEQFEEFCKKTQPADAPLTVSLAPPTATDSVVEIDLDFSKANISDHECNK